MVITDDIRHLFKLVKHALGAPIRPVQLTDEQMCSLLEMSIGDYAEKVQNWVLKCNWMNIQNKDAIVFQNPSFSGAKSTHIGSARRLDYSKGAHMNSRRIFSKWKEASKSM